MNIASVFVLLKFAHVFRSPVELRSTVQAEARTHLAAMTRNGIRIRRMRIVLAYLCCFASVFTAPVLAQVNYNSGNRMLRPANYREWTWLSSGYGTAYVPETAGREDPNPLFHNVFVNPSAYRAFLQTGKWPDKTVFVLELRASVEKGSINPRGSFQGDVQHLEVHVKDERRFPNKWAFFSFSPTASAANMIPVKQECYACHEQHGALDTTFAQFYPIIRETAKQMGTLKPDR